MFSFRPRIASPPSKGDFRRCETEPRPSGSERKASEARNRRIEFSASCLEPRSAGDFRRSGCPLAGRDRSSPPQSEGPIQRPILRQKPQHFSWFPSPGEQARGYWSFHADSSGSGRPHPRRSAAKKNRGLPLGWSCHSLVRVPRQSRVGAKQDTRIEQVARQRSRKERQRGYETLRQPS